jgi:TolB protein
MTVRKIPAASAIAFIVTFVVLCFYGGMSTVYAAENVKITAGDNFISPCWNPAGDLIAFGKDQAIWVMDSEGRYQEEVYDSMVWDGDPAFDVSGEKIFFASQHHGAFDADHINIWVVGLDGDHRLQLTRNTDCRYPVPSPDGKYVAYLSDISGNFDIWLMEPSGDNKTALTSTSGAEGRVSWYPSGDRLVYSLNGDLWTIWLNGTTVRITDTDYEETHPAVSPDGNWIAYIADRDDETDLWVMNPEGNRQGRITYDMAEENAPVWNPDGETIAYVSDSGGENSIWLASFEPSEVVYFPADQDQNGISEEVDGLLDYMYENPLYAIGAIVILGVFVIYFLALFFSRDF